MRQHQQRMPKNAMRSLVILATEAWLHSMLFCLLLLVMASTDCHDIDAKCALLAHMTTRLRTMTVIIISCRPATAAKTAHVQHGTACHDELNRASNSWDGLCVGRCSRFNQAHQSAR